MTEEWRDEFRQKFATTGCNHSLGYSQVPQPTAASMEVESFISQQRKEAAREAIGKIGAKLLANHSPQAVLDAYFEVANELIEEYEPNN